VKNCENECRIAGETEDRIYVNQKPSNSFQRKNVSRLTCAERPFVIFFNGDSPAMTIPNSHLMTIADGKGCNLAIPAIWVVECVAFVQGGATVLWFRPFRYRV
jgi:hypothetical protein